MLGLLITIPAQAATEEQIEQAAIDGLKWLAGDPAIEGDHGQQQDNGSWSNHTAVTCLALVKLQERALELGFDSPFDPEYPYSDEIVAGWQYVFGGNRTQKQSISDQTYGDPDTNNNGYGVYFQYDDYHNNYTTGICLMALVSSSTPNRPNDVNLDFDSDSDADTFKDLVQEAVDWLAFSQTDSGYGRGGWYYNYHNNSGSRADNSITGYSVLGLRYAETPAFNFACTIPAFVKSELDIWIDYIQNDSNGGSGYSSPDSWVNILKTGNLLFEMSFVGDTVDTQRVKNAIGYIESNWNSNADPGWRPNHYQAIYCLMKGFESLDIDIIEVGGSEIDWFDEMSTVIFEQQNDDGSWSGCPYYCSGSSCNTADSNLCTEWALLTLEKVAPPPPINVEVSLPDCACEDDGYTVEISYTVERFHVNGTLNIYEGDNLIRTVDLSNFTGTAVESIVVDLIHQERILGRQSWKSRRWKAVLPDRLTTRLP